MTRDKQLLNIALADVLEKRRLDQALNAKEFAVLAGISYSAARAWFRQPGFPAFSGVVFWQDFVQWRSVKNRLLSADFPALGHCQPQSFSAGDAGMRFEGRAAQVLAEAT